MASPNLLYTCCSPRATLSVSDVDEARGETESSVLRWKGTPAQGSMVRHGLRSQKYNRGIVQIQNDLCNGRSGSRGGTRGRSRVGAGVGPRAGPGVGPGVGPEVGSGAGPVVGPALGRC